MLIAHTVWAALVAKRRHVDSDDCLDLGASVASMLSVGRLFNSTGHMFIKMELLVLSVKLSDRSSS